MFHWICPECGREIPPSMRECQACDPHAAPLSVVELVESTPAAPIVSAPAIETEAVAVAKSPDPVDDPPTPPPAIAAQSVDPVAEVLEITQEIPIRKAAEPTSEIPEPVQVEAVAEVVAPPEPTVESLPPVEQLQQVTELIVETPVIIETAAEETVPVETAPLPPAASEPVAEQPVEAFSPEAGLDTAALEEPKPVAVETDVLVVAPPEPVLDAEETVPVETAPLPAAASEPVAEQPVEALSPEPVFDTAALAEPKPVAVEIDVLVVAPPEPVLDADPAPEPELVAIEAIPLPAETAPIGQIAEMSVEASAEPEPVLDTVQAPEPVAVEAAPIPSEAPEAAPVSEPILQNLLVAEQCLPVEAALADAAVQLPLLLPPPVVEETVSAQAETPTIVDAIPELEVTPEPPSEAAVTTEPIVETVAATVPEASENPIKLQDVPDPLLALAEEIRAAQAARAAALTEPAHSTGLLELAEAVGVQQQSVQEQVVEPSHQVQSSEPIQETRVAPETAGVMEATTAVALLAPPLIATEPVSFHELRPVALAPEPTPNPVAEPEPFNPPEIPSAATPTAETPSLGTLAAEPPTEPQEPVALAPEPKPESEGPTLPLAPMQDYTPATSRSILPVPPRAQILAADSGPRITLPGPTLPPELTRLQDANVLTVMGENTVQRTKEAMPPPKSAGAPGWLVSGFVMLLLLAAGLGVVFYLLPHTVADAKPTPTPAVAATAPVPTGGNSPLAKFVEVTGFRIVTSSADAGKDANKKDAAKKSEVQYLVVNHSDADISDANVFVTLRSAKPGQAPVCRFSFKVPSLGPFESKEMSSPIGNATRSISLPDWQEIRAEVQISQ